MPSGLPLLKYSSCAPGAATTLNVGFGMYSLIVPFTVILVRPSMSMYLMTFLNGSSTNFVSASGVSYMWLSASKIGKSRIRDGTVASWLVRLAVRAQV